MPTPIALFRHFPELESQLPWASLGEWPTPVEALPELARALGCDPIWIKREDLSSPRFGGNKIRTLESLIGHAKAKGADRIWSTGAYGSNHACALAMHGDLAGIATGALLFPQPPTDAAANNFLALVSTGCKVRRLSTPIALPFSAAKLWRDGKRNGERPYIMAPGGATPRGAIGHVSEALELAEQVDAGECAAPRRIVLAVGSTCTTAGLLVGLRLAARLGIGWGNARAPIPDVVAVRVTPWPITSVPAIIQLARGTSKYLASMIGSAGEFGHRELRSIVTLDRNYYGGGYGKPTSPGAEARRLFDETGGPPLDCVYTEKSAAAFIAHARRRDPGPLMYWATRTSASLPTPTDEQLDAVDPVIRRWLAKPRA